MGSRGFRGFDKLPINRLGRPVYYTPTDNVGGIRKGSLSVLFCFTRTLCPGKREDYTYTKEVGQKHINKELLLTKKLDHALLKLNPHVTFFFVAWEIIKPGVASFRIV